MTNERGQPTQEEPTRESESNEILDAARAVAATFLGGVSFMLSPKAPSFEEARGRAEEMLGGEPYAPPPTPPVPPEVNAEPKRTR